MIVLVTRDRKIIFIKKIFRVNTRCRTNFSIKYQLSIRNVLVKIALLHKYLGIYLQQSTNQTVQFFLNVVVHNCVLRVSYQRNVSLILLFWKEQEKLTFAHLSPQFYRKILLIFYCCTMFLIFFLTSLEIYVKNASKTGE